MDTPEPEAQSAKRPAKRGGIPIGLFVGAVIGYSIGLIKGDVAAGAGLAVALGISFWMLTPLVRKILAPKTSDDAAEQSNSASSQEKDSK